VTGVFDPFSTVLNTRRNYVGMRYFVCVPAGATVTDATLTFVSSTNRSGAANAQIEAERVPESESFATNPSIIGRFRSQNAVPWTMPAFVTGSSYESPSISVLIEEIIGLDGWTGCGNILLVLTNDGRRDMQAFDADPNEAPILNITFEP